MNIRKQTHSSWAHETIRQVQKAVIGKELCVQKVMMALLSSGHVLLEDIPGVGKTTMALAFAKAMSLKENRLTFTPDVLPADLTGFTMYRKETGQFYYQPGAVMCNLFLGDEINRTSPRTQSALLEVMEENQVSVDGVTHPLPRPFFVIATENPAGSAGTQRLPQSQLDRFAVCLSLGYPDMEEEIAIIKGRIAQNTIELIEPAVTASQVLTMQEETRQVFVHDRIYRYIGTLIQATRNMQNFELLKELGKIRKPILLKRGMANTLEELLMSAEYIMAGGNEQVILCERGIRTFETSMRNTLDISAIPMLKSKTHLPVIVDPSHAAGIRFMVEPLTMAAIAAGADGVMIEVHNNPEKALCDGKQSLTPESFCQLMEKVKKTTGFFQKKM